MAKKKRKKAGKKRKSYRRNPGGVLKKALDKKNVINIVSLGVGFVGGIKAQKFINNVEALMNFRRFTGAIPFILGSVIGVKGKRDSAKSFGSGLALSGLYDLLTQNVPQIGLSPVEGVDLEDDTYNYGTALDLEGNVIDLEGEDATLVGGQDEVLVGEEDGSPYAMV